MKNFLLLDVNYIKLSASNHQSVAYEYFLLKTRKVITISTIYGLELMKHFRICIKTRIEIFTIFFRFTWIKFLLNFLKFLNYTIQSLVIAINILHS